MASAMHEFAQGYERASMARIAAGAGVSKALAFHYFDGKQGLFAHAYARGMALLYASVADARAVEGDDLFSAVERMAVAKGRLLSTDPHLSSFMLTAWYDTAPEALRAREGCDAPVMEQVREGLIALARCTRLHPEVTPEMAADLLTWTSESFVQDELNHGRLEERELVERFRGILQILRRGLQPEGKET